MPLAQFCLIEQLLPNGAEYPFADRMLRHFRHLNSPLKSVDQYPQADDQEKRFLAAQYHSARGRSLWQIWNDNEFVDEDLRLSVMNKEPFDEWEEFMLFAHHYALVEAWNGVKLRFPAQKSIPETQFLRSNSEFLPKTNDSEDNGSFLSCRTYKLPDKVPSRRYGASWAVDDGVIGHHGGLGRQCRLDTTDLYQLSHSPLSPRNAVPTLDRPRMCHTITGLSLGTALLVGGRTSPDNALADCWIYSVNYWRKAHDLPRPLYRHCAAVVMQSSSPGVLIFGGRHTKGAVSDRWYLWSACDGWIEPSTSNVKPEGRFSSTIIALSSTQGLLFGGLRADSTICYDLWIWTLSEHGGRGFLEFQDLSNVESFQEQQHLICRVGACAVQRSSRIVIAGGTGNKVFAQQEEIIEIYMDLGRSTIRLRPPIHFQGTERMLLVGHTMVNTGQSFAIFGGGATCFSFGSCWNQGNYILDLAGNTEPWKSEQNAQKRVLKVIPQRDAANCAKQLGDETDDTNAMGSKVSRFRIETAKDFDLKIAESQPFIMKGLDLGPCTDNWTLDVLRIKVGEDREVGILQVVHDFIAYADR